MEKIKKKEINNEKSSWKLKFPSKEIIKEKFEKLCGFELEDLTNYERFVKLLYQPTDPASLGVARALFGLCMVIDIVDERGLADIDLKWGSPYACHFPLIHGMKPPTLPYMIVLYTLMWMGSFGIMLGFCFKLACACFVIPYWYIFILDKSFWNNHSYLYGIIGTLFWGTCANRYFSIDSKLSKKSLNQVPYWNYFILKFQFFVLYFLAGLKKSNREWLEGYSMTNLSEHWVFDPFKLFLTTEQTDYLIVHWFGFIFDLTVGFWLVFEKTRIPAMVFCAAFHFMNSRLFSIGMFPYTCMATMGLFCNADWPRKLISFIKNSNIFESCQKCKTHIEKNQRKIISNSIQDENYDSENENFERNQMKLVSAWMPKPISQEEKIKLKKPKKKKKLLVLFLLVHIILQFFLPYSHFITKGYNNWVPGLYGYSWDMMVHSWDTILVVIKVHDNVNGKDHFIDPHAWVQNDRWTKHGDMAIQYAQCLKNNLLRRKKDIIKSPKKIKDTNEWSKLSSNLSIYIDVRCSLNGRFQQRIFDPNVDLLTVDWHPLKPISFLKPLLNQYNSYRQKMDEITKEVYTWSNYTDVFFVADYPEMKMENYFNDDFSNVSLTVLEGQVTYSEENWTEKITVNKDHTVPIKTEKLHEVVTTSAYPSCYMYTYTNQTREKLAMNGISEPPRKRPGFPIFKEFKYKINSWWRALGHIANAFFYLAYDVPMLRRVPRQPNYHEDYYR